jgi:hypothetical protein
MVGQTFLSLPGERRNAKSSWITRKEKTKASLPRRTEVFGQKLFEALVRKYGRVRLTYMAETDRWDVFSGDALLLFNNS